MKTIKGTKETMVGTCDFGPLIHVTDCCYDRDTHCAAFNLKIKAGNYNCYAVESNFSCWGNRVCEISIILEGYSRYDLSEVLTDYDIGVDSGQAGFFDDSIYPHVPEGVDKYEYPEFDYSNEKGFYKQACNLAHIKGEDKNFGIGFNKKGFNSSSGFGDGGYSLYVYTNNEGEICGAKIVFIGEEEMNEDED